MLGVHHRPPRIASALAELTRLRSEWADDPKLQLEAALVFLMAGGTASALESYAEVLAVLDPAIERLVG